MSSFAKKCWSESFGVYGSTIRVAEREPGGILYLLWIDKSGKQQKRSLQHRDRRRGRRQALELASKLTRTHQIPSEPEPLRLAEGIEMALDPGSGMYAVETRHVREARRLLERALNILGSEMTWDQLTPGRVQSLVRTLARENAQGRGVRSAEYMCDMLYGVAGWLRDEGLIPESVAHPRRNWKVRLKQDWQAITGLAPEVKQPRHSPEEVAKIFAALPDADPRLRLLIELAAELRAGQAVRARRSDLDLSNLGRYGLGRFTVRGRGRKSGEVVDLHPEQREVVDEMLMVGYLRDVEAAFRRREISDYFLFPAGRVVKGRALLMRCQEAHLGEKSIRGMFATVEQIAGVKHVAGRALYGLRRQGADLAADIETDDRVLDRLTGHLDSETRKRVYQDRQSDGLRARAAEVRRSMRQRLRAGTVAG